MPRPIVVLISWIKLGALSMASFAQDVYDAMKGNLSFPTPAVDLEVLSTAAQTVVDTYGKRKNGAVAKLAAKNAVDNLNDLLHTQAAYVSKVANGSVDIIVSANFESTKADNTSAVKPGTPVPPQLSTDDGGILHMHLKNAIKGADNYCWIIFLDVVVNITVIDNRLIIPSGANIIIIPCGTTTETVTGLTPQTKVTVMVLAQNAAGKSSFSPMITKGIQ